MHLANFAEGGQFEPRKIAAALRTSAEEIAVTVGLGKDALQRRTRINSDKTQRRLRELVEVLNKVGAAAKQAGLRFAVHNHTMEFAQDNGRPGYDYLLSHTDKDLVYYEIDCGWITVAGYKPSEFINRYPGRIKMLHIKDFVAIDKGAATGPNSPKGAEIGTGVVNYKEIFASVKGKNIEHIFVEQEGPYSRMPAMEAAAVDYKYLHSLS